MKTDVAVSTANFVHFLHPRFFDVSRSRQVPLFQPVPVWTCVWACIMMECLCGNCDDNANAHSRPMNVVLHMNATLFPKIETPTLLTEFAEYQNLRISFDVKPSPLSDFAEPTQPEDEMQMWNEAMSELKTTDTDAIVWFSGDDTVSIYLFTLRGDRFVRKRVIENGAAFNLESISAILRGWFDVLPAMDAPPASKPAPPAQSALTPAPTSTPSPATSFSPDQIAVRITSGKLSVIQPADARTAVFQMEGAAMATYASLWLFGGQIAIAVEFHCKYALFVSGGVYNHSKTTYQNITFKLHKYPIALGIRRLWHFKRIQLGAAIEVEAEVYRRQLLDQTWSGKTGFQPSILAMGRFTWHFSRRFKLFVDFGLRVVVREPVFDIIVHSATVTAAATNEDTDETRRVVLYDADIVQPIAIMGVSLKF